jgi:hypothetical protein
MRNFICALVLALLPLSAAATEDLEWAYPVTPKAEPPDHVVLKQMPGSARQYTQAQIDAPFNAPDW